jgi:hypothetical protein
LLIYFIIENKLSKKLWLKFNLNLPVVKNVQTRTHRPSKINSLNDLVMIDENKYQNDDILYLAKLGDSKSKKKRIIYYHHFEEDDQESNDDDNYSVYYGNYL